MLVVDIEATGLIYNKNSIISIGGVDFDRPERQFYEECRMWEGAEINPEGLLVSGFTEAEVTDPNKQSLQSLMQSFFHWVEQSPDKTLAGQNVTLDRDYLNFSFAYARIDFQFAHRVVDLHSVAYADHLRRGIPVPLRNDRTDLNLEGVLKYAGVHGEEVPHHGLIDAKLEAEAFSRILRGTSLFEEYAKYPLPDFLKA
jgi:DNA polymerase III epsilon subunit-like protein